MAQLAWKPSEPGKTRGSSLEMNEPLLKQVMTAVRDSKNKAVETEMKAFTKELGYEGQAAASTITYLINKKLKALGHPIKCGYTNKGKSIKFFQHVWKEDPEEEEEEKAQ